MISVRAAAVVTQFIGVMWALLALVYPSTGQTINDFTLGITVTAAGFAAWLAVDWWENHR